MSKTDSIFKHHNIFSKTGVSLVRNEFCIECSITLKPSIGLERSSFFMINGYHQIEIIFLRRLTSSVTTSLTLITSVSFTAFKEASDLPSINMGFGWPYYKISYATTPYATTNLIMLLVSYKLSWGFFFS